MSVSVPRLFAAVLALIVSLLTVVTVIGIVAANALIDRGFGAVSAADAALLDDLVLASPVVAGLAGLLALGAVGLLVGARRSRVVVGGIAAVGAAASIGAAIALALGNDPFVSAGHGHTIDGIGMVLAAAIVMVAIVIAVVADESPNGPVIRRAV